MQELSDLTTIGITNESNVLAVFPHPDDETAYGGGLLQKIVKEQAQLKLITITNGEASTLKNGVGNSQPLSEVRKDELQTALHTLGITDFEFGQFPDYQTKDMTEEITRYLAEKIKSFSPNFIITLEPNGIYGHPDHIALSQIVANLHEKLNTFTVVYLTVVDELYDSSHEANRVVENPDRIRATDPQYKLHLTTEETENKIKAFQAHMSQFNVDESFLETWENRRLLSNEYFYLEG